MYYAPENPMYDPYYGKYVHGHDIRSARVYEPDELPFWLAIGPICWEASYNPKHVYIKGRTGDNSFGIINIISGDFILI